MKIILEQPSLKKKFDSMITIKTLSTSQLLEPMTYKEAMSSTKKQEWENAIAKEYKSLIQNGTWELTGFPKGKNKIGCKWVFKRKLKANGSIDRYKARLVAKGYSQIHGLDYHEKNSLVMKIA
jgi:hypothetical protein